MRFTVELDDTYTVGDRVKIINFNNSDLDGRKGVITGLGLIGLMSSFIVTLDEQLEIPEYEGPAWSSILVLKHCLTHIDLPTNALVTI